MSESARSPSQAYAWLVVALLVFAAIISYTDRQILSLIVGPISTSLKISDIQMSLLLGSAFAFIYGTVGLLMGYLADRYNRRNLIIGGVIVWSLATFACGLSHSFDSIFIARAFVGMGEAVLTPAAISMISDCFPPERRGTAVSVYITSVPIGSGVAIVAGGLVLHAVSAGRFNFGPLQSLEPWRVVLIIFGVPGLLLIGLLLLIREPGRHDDHPMGDETPRPHQGYARERPNFKFILAIAPLFIAIALISVVNNAAGAWTSSLLIRNFSLSPSDVGVRFGIIYGLSGGIGILLAGFLGDRFAARGGTQARIAMCLAAAILTIPLTMFGLCHSVPLVLTGAGLYLLLADGTTSAGIVAILNLVKNRNRGMATAIIFFLNVAIGAGLGPTLVAEVSNRMARNGHGLGDGLFWVGSVVFLLVTISLALGFQLNKRKEPETDGGNDVEPAKFTQSAAGQTASS